MVRYAFLALATTVLAHPYSHLHLHHRDVQLDESNSAPGPHPNSTESWPPHPPTTTHSWPPHPSTTSVKPPPTTFSYPSTTLPKPPTTTHYAPTSTAKPPQSSSHPFGIESTGQQAPASCAVNSINNQDGVGSGVDRYVLYKGNGTPGAGWPDKSKWVSFENMFNNYKNQMFGSCSQFGQANDSGPEVGSIYNAIQQIAQETKVDHRFILAVIMQESGGCVRAPTTNYGVRNPGLMQDHNGSATCNENGYVANPCSQDQITQMVREGTGGTSSGDGLAGTMGQAVNYGGGGSAATYYRAARIYNSGSIDGSGNLEAGIATHCYSSDIANRLTGWVNAAHGCNLG